MLANKAPSFSSDIVSAQVIKAGDLFFLSAPDGTIPLEANHGLGLYFDDCRFLDGFEVRLAGSELFPLVATTVGGFHAIFELSNPRLHVKGKQIETESLGVTLTHLIDSANRALISRLSLENYTCETFHLPLALTFRAGFEDVFQVRGLMDAQTGCQHEPAWTDQQLCFAYDGVDGRSRTTHVGFDPLPVHCQGTTVRFDLELPPRSCRQITVTTTVNETQAQPGGEGPERQVPSALQTSLKEKSDNWLTTHTRFQSNSDLFNRVMERSLRDLHTLRTGLDHKWFFAAGIPWFCTLFGRDSLISAIQALPFNTDMVVSTLRLLARYQGTREDAWRDEQPGKILHELRTGELVRSGQIPHSPYYGSVDATPLFLIALAKHAAWIGDLSLFKSLLPHVERALAWIGQYGMHDGYLAYRAESSHGLINQGWKDSGDAIVHVDGSLATPPIALAEVQGYVYLAKLGIAGLFRRMGDPQRAERLEREADALRQRFNRDFWMPAEGCFALALEKEQRQVQVVTSNAGQVLWSGIADGDKAKQTAKRLMQPDLFSGWGIRTLSENAGSFNPVGYHIGTVWPHDNALIGAGFRRYGLDRDFLAIFDGILQASVHFDGFRLPEVFAGFSQSAFPVPVRYPVACHPQAWAAGTVPYLLEQVLGLIPDAFEHRLIIRRPCLPGSVDGLTVTGLTIAGSPLDLRFVRARGDQVSVHVLKNPGDLDVEIRED